MTAGPHLDVGVLLLEETARAGDGATSAHTANEDVHLALCRAPDLWAGRLIVDAGVVGVLKLLQDEGVRSVGSNLLRLCDSTLRVVATSASA